MDLPDCTLSQSLSHLVFWKCFYNVASCVKKYLIIWVDKGYLVNTILFVSLFESWLVSFPFLSFLFIQKPLPSLKVSDAFEIRPKQITIRSPDIALKTQMKCPLYHYQADLQSCRIFHALSFSAPCQMTIYSQSRYNTCVYNANTLPSYFKNVLCCEILLLTYCEIRSFFTVHAHLAKDRSVINKCSFVCVCIFLIGWNVETTAEVTAISVYTSKHWTIGYPRNSVVSKRQL